MLRTLVLWPGRSWDFTKAKLYTDFSGVQKNGWRLWPLASWITYQYIPLRLRVLFVNVVAFFWCASSTPSSSLAYCKVVTCCILMPGSHRITSSNRTLWQPGVGRL